MEKSWKQEEIFPLIYGIITDHTCRDSAFVGHAEIAKLLLESRHGAEAIAAAAEVNELGVKGTASNMVAWFSQSYSVGESAYRRLLERRKEASRWAYRSTQREPTMRGGAEASLPDPDAGAVEGAPKLVTHLQAERAPALVAKKFAAVQKSAGRLACECCGFEASETFPGLGAPIVEVHHRVPLSTYKGAKVTKLEALALLCPTCHRAIHRCAELTVEEFRARYFRGRR